MVQWNGRNLENLPRSDVERVAYEAVVELVGLRELHQRRENCDTVILSFVSGAAFIGAAIIMGLMFH